MKIKEIKQQIPDIMKRKPCKISKFFKIWIEGDWVIKALRDDLSYPNNHEPKVVHEGYKKLKALEITTILFPKTCYSKKYDVLIQEYIPGRDLLKNNEEDKRIFSCIKEEFEAAGLGGGYRFVLQYRNIRVDNKLQYWLIDLD